MYNIFKRLVMKNKIDIESVPEEFREQIKTELGITDESADSWAM